MDRRGQSFGEIRRLGDGHGTDKRGISRRSSLDLNKKD